MGVFNPSILTEKGRALVAKAVMGVCDVTFTRIAISDTRLTGDLEYIADIGAVKQSAPVTSVERTEGSHVKVGTAFTNEGLSAGYYIRNLGLFAQDPDEGEILYSVSVADESEAIADWMPSASSIGVSSIAVDMYTVVANAANLTLTVNPSAYATVTQVAHLQKQLDLVGYEEDIYGIEIDFSNKTISRIAGSEYLKAGAGFSELAPWGGRKRCILTNGGVKLAYYGEAGYTESGALTQALTVGGTTYPIGTAVQVMVEQPVFYIKAVPVKAENAASGKGKQYVKARFYISPTPKDGFSIPRAFYDAHGTPQDYIYLSAYEGSPQDKDGVYTKDDSIAIVSGNESYFKLSSIAGAKPMSGLKSELTRGRARTLATNRGAGWQLHNIFAMSVTEWLFMVEYASLDPQRMVGQGVCNLTDDNATNMAVVTGATSALGNGSGIPAGGEDGKCSVTYRGEENLWGNIWTWLDGVNILAKGVNSVWVPKIGTTPKDDTTEGYECLSAYASRTDGFVSSFGIDNRYPEVLIPTEADGSDTFADYVSQYCSYNGFLVTGAGGRWADGSKCGLYVGLNSPSSSVTRNVGARLLYVPQSITS